MNPYELKPDESKRPGFPRWGWLLIAWGILLGIVVIITLAIVVPLLLQEATKQLPMPW